MNGTFAPGAILSQLELSKALGVSRTPLREAFRMLQEEGLIEAEPNLRARVSACSPDDLTSVYASRIVLEALGIALTATNFSQEQRDVAEEALEQMHMASARNNFPDWLKAHRTFHSSLNSDAGQELSRVLLTLVERGERYLHVYQPQNGRTWWSYDNETEHRQLLQACIEHNGKEGAQLMARHLAVFANNVLKEIEATQQSNAIQVALQVVENKVSEWKLVGGHVEQG
jgi:DNA-binding GntR family transcriptional regulator